jgi:hypothetical protein
MLATPSTETSSTTRNELFAETPSPNVKANLNTKLVNPLAGLTRDQVVADAEAFANTHGLDHLVEEFKKGALVAQDPLGFDSLPLLSEEDKAIFRREIEHKWDQPKMLYYLVILCSVAAAVQGVRFRAYYTLSLVWLLIGMFTDGRIGHQWCQPVLCAPVLAMKAM